MLLYLLLAPPDHPGLVADAGACENDAYDRRQGSCEGRKQYLCTAHDEQRADNSGQDKDCPVLESPDDNDAPPSMLRYSSLSRFAFNDIKGASSRKIKSPVLVCAVGSLSIDKSAVPTGRFPNTYISGRAKKPSKSRIESVTAISSPASIPRIKTLASANSDR